MCGSNNSVKFFQFKYEYLTLNTDYHIKWGRYKGKDKKRIEKKIDQGGNVHKPNARDGETGSSLRLETSS